MTNNNALDNALVELINNVNKAGEFVAGQIPDVINQLLLWKLVEHSVKFGIGAIAILCAIVCLWKFTSACFHAYNSYDVGDEQVLPTIIYGTGAMFCSVIGGNLINLRWLQILLAPKVYLIEYAAQLVNR